MRNKKKIVSIIVSVIAVLAATVGASIAYLQSETSEVKNSFAPVYVDCEVIETFDKITKSDVAVKNTGDIDAYVRVTYIVMWTSESGTVYGEAPKAGVDYEIQFGSSLWHKSSDGFYYYENSLAAEKTSETFIKELTVLKKPPEEGHRLTVHVAATAIQAEPQRAVENAWGVTVGEGGRLIVD